MHWGWQAAGPGGSQDVTYAEYMEAFGMEPPDPPAIPPAGEHIWALWWQLNDRRPPGFDQLCPISYTEISHWLQLTGQHLAPEEIQWLTDMDNAWIAAVAEQRREKQEREKAKAESPTRGK